jgi:hypothetical protein
VTDHTITDIEAARLRREKQNLLTVLIQHGLTNFQIGVTGHHGGGRPHAWASIPVDDAAHLHHTLTEAGYTVRVGVHTLSVQTGEAA